MVPQNQQQTQRSVGKFNDMAGSYPVYISNVFHYERPHEGRASSKPPELSHKHTRSCLSHQYTANSHRTGGETSPNSSRRQIPRATDCQMFPSPTSVSLYMAANHRHQITLQTGMLIQVVEEKMVLAVRNSIQGPYVYIYVTLSQTFNSRGHMSCVS